jgi:hypothetical protein
LTISPDKQWKEPSEKKAEKGYTGKMQPKSRSSIILHEILEIVRRTLDGCNYDDAHSDASNEEASLPPSDPRRSKHPGIAR